MRFFEIARIPKSELGEDATAPQYVYRVDSQPIHDFDTSPQTYKHTSDWQQSGLASDPQNDWTGKKVKTAKGTFAGTLESREIILVTWS